MQRFGMTVPFDGQQLTSSETVSNDSNGWATPTSGPPRPWAPMASPRSRLAPSGPHRCGSVRRSSRRTRGPALLAQSVAGLASAAPGRFVLGIGSSSNVIVERWNGIPFEKPFQQTRDMVRFLKAALGGEKVTETYDTLTSRASDSAWCLSSRYRFSWRRFARGCCAWRPRKRRGHHQLAVGRQRCHRVEHRPGGKPDAEIVARLFVAPTPDTESARSMGKLPRRPT